MYYIFIYEKQIFNSLTLSKHNTKTSDSFWKKTKIITNVENNTFKLSYFGYLSLFLQKRVFISKSYLKKQYQHVLNYNVSGKTVATLPKNVAECLLDKIFREYIKIQLPSPQKTYKVTSNAIKIILKNCPLETKNFCLQKTENTYFPDIAIGVSYLIKQVSLGQKLFFLNFFQLSRIKTRKQGNVATNLLD